MVCPQNNRLFGATEVAVIVMWNVRTLSHDEDIDLLLNSLAAYRWNVVGARETIWSEMREMSINALKILHSGGTGAKQAGVALILSKSASMALVSYRPINDRLISARFRTQTGYVTVYVRTADSSEKNIEIFYKTLQHEIDSIPRRDIRIIMSNS